MVQELDETDETLLNLIEKGWQDENTEDINRMLDDQESHEEQYEVSEKDFPEEEISNAEEEENEDEIFHEENPNEIVEQAKQVEEGVNEKKQKRKRSQENQRQVNKLKRMTGEEFLGFSKPKNQKNTFNDTPRPCRILKVRCECGLEKEKSKFKCSLITDEERESIFKSFWT